MISDLSTVNDQSLIINSQLFNYFNQIRVDSSHGNSDDTLYLDNHTAVAGTLYFQESTLLTLNVTTRDTNFSSFRQVQFIRLEVQQMVIVGTGNGNEALHFTVGDNDL